MTFRAAAVGFPLLASLALVSSGQLVSFGQNAPRPAEPGKGIGAAPADRRAPDAATRPTVRGPALLDDAGKPIAGVSLWRADVHAVVRGPLAETIVTLTFKNNQARVLGGELTFPLPDGATVSGYGLDVGGVMVDGVAVEKQQARVIYETEMRKTVDPGLVEHVVGNNFRTRLYPIPANGERTVKVRYVADLIPTADRKGAALSLPLAFGEKLDRFDLTIAVEGATEEPVVRGGTYANKPFQQVDRGYYLKESLKDAKAVETLTITLPEVPASSVTVQMRPPEPTTVEELEKRRGDKGPPTPQGYFVLTDTPTMPRLEPVAMVNQRLLVVWDASLGRQSADLKREIALLEQLLKRLNYPSLDLVFLRNDLEIKPFFGSGEAESRRAVELIRNAVYDGGTNLGALSLPKNLADFGTVQIAQAQKDYDFAVLFSDGLGNLGSEKPAKVAIPVWAISTDAGANHNALRSLCQESGGAYLNLNRQDDAMAIASVGQPTFSVIAVEADPKQVADVTPGIGTAISGRVTVAGRLLAGRTAVTLVYGHGKSETSRKTFTIDPANATEGTLVARYWAQQKVNELSLAGDAHRAELLELGKQHQLVTPATSLLVLETVEQYVQHGIVPPKNRPEIYNAFTQQIETRRAEREKTKEQKIEMIAARWNERVAWWEKTFTYPKDLKVKPETKGDLAVDTTAELAPASGPQGAVFAPPAVRQPQPAEPARAAQPALPGTPQSRTPMNRDGSVPNFDNAPDFNLSSRSDSQREAGGNAGGGGGLFGNGGPAQRNQRGLVDELNQTVSDPKPAGASRIDIKAWDPKTPYLAKMKAVAADRAYDVYLAERKDYATSPAFFFDCAEYLLKAGRREQGLRVLSDVLELKFEDPRLIRIVAHRLQQLDELDLAIGLFEKVARLRPEEPQSFRDLALALSARADKRLASPSDKFPSGQIAADYGRALDLLNQVVTGNWQRFEDIELIALMEANRILAVLQRTPNLGGVPNPIDPRLRKNLDCDVRILLTWDTDATDVDLWVTEPSAEKCLYSHNRTTIGGAMSRDFTQGYGPEEYFLRRRMPGEYRIEANFYGSSQQELTGATTVQATVITNFGRPNEERKQMTLRLSTAKEMAEIGKVVLEGER